MLHVWFKYLLIANSTTMSRLRNCKRQLNAKTKHAANNKLNSVTAQYSHLLNACS